MSYNVKGKPFVFKGAYDVSDCNTSEEVMQAAHLNWTVDKCEIAAMTTDGPKMVNNAYATIRTDNNTPLGVVKDRYTIVQNSDAFKFFDNAIGKNKAIWQTAGCFNDGARIFVSAKLPNNILINGDPIENYLVFTTNHDGTGGVRILFTPIRVICQNTLNAAIKGSDNYVSFRHTKSVHENIDIADQILGISKSKIDMFNVQMDRMQKIKLNDNDAAKVFVSTILNENEMKALEDTGHTATQLVYRDWKTIQDANISMKKVNVISEMNNYYFDGVGQRQLRGTGYGVYNAVSGYYSNIDNADGTKRMDSILYGDKSRKIQKAGELILAY